MLRSPLITKRMESTYYLLWQNKCNESKYILIFFREGSRSESEWTVVHCHMWWARRHPIRGNARPGEQLSSQVVALYDHKCDKFNVYYGVNDVTVL